MLELHRWRGDPLWADEAKLFVPPRKREEFVLQAEEAGGVLQALATTNHSEMGSSSLSLTFLCGHSAHLLPWCGHRGSPSARRGHARQPRALRLPNWELPQRRRAA